jgi:hypothetical protein
MTVGIAISLGRRVVLRVRPPRVLRGGNLEAPGPVREVRTAPAGGVQDLPSPCFHRESAGKRPGRTLPPCPSAGLL